MEKSGTTGVVVQLGDCRPEHIKTKTDSPEKKKREKKRGREKKRRTQKSLQKIK